MTGNKEPLSSLQIPCKNRYGNIAYFEDYDNMVLIGFGDEEGFEPDKDALKFDKKHLPKVIAFLQKALKHK